MDFVQKPNNCSGLPSFFLKFPFHTLLFTVSKEQFSGTGGSRRLKYLPEKMEAPKIIEQAIGGLNNDALRFGLHGVKSDIVGAHPLESAYQSASVREEQVKRKIHVNTYGSAFPLKMELDRKILSRFHRPPGVIPSSMLGLEAITGALEDFGVEDYLSDAHDSEAIRVPDMHHGMEVRLGLSEGPISPSFM